MATKKTIETVNDKKDKISVVEIIQDIDFRLTHLEDMQADNRELMAKLVTQGNTIVKFLKQFEVKEIDPSEMGVEIGLPELPDLSDTSGIERTERLKELVDELIDRHKDMDEFERELEKHKGKITPGQVGES
jgi:hypothetical protein